MVTPDECGQATEHPQPPMTADRRALEQEHASVDRHQRNALLENLVARMHPGTKQERDAKEKKPVPGKPASRKQTGQHSKALEEYAGEPHRIYTFTETITPSCRPKITARIIRLKIADRNLAKPDCLRP